jgi:hypothetical protein
MYNTVDKELFSQACDKMVGRLQGQNGIGTLKEKTIHSVLKYYYAPNPIYHEVKIGGFVADICVDGEIFEVQTRGFNKMRDKLSYFLAEHDVTIIYPVAHTKWLSWLDMESGEVTSRRKSPKTGTIYNIIPELYKIKMFINNPKLHFIICLIDVEETRYLNGWSRDKKRGSSRMDGIPVGIFDEARIDVLDDYKIFIPDSMPNEFTSGELGIAAHIPTNRAGTLLNVLLEVGVVTRVGKRGNSYLYKIAAPS